MLNQKRSSDDPNRRIKVQNVDSNVFIYSSTARFIESNSNTAPDRKVLEQPPPSLPLDTQVDEN